MAGEGKALIRGVGRNKLMIKYGVVFGRFQIVHNDHVRYIMAAKERCNNLIVGISNPDPMHTKGEPTDLKRSSFRANPLTYFERYYMIQAVLRGQGVDDKEFIIVPFPINYPEYCRYYIPQDATIYLTIYDEWGEEKYNKLTSLGFYVEVLWRRPASEKGISSTQVRESISAERPYKHLVPPSVYALIREWQIDQRIKGLYRTPDDDSPYTLSS